MIFSAAAALSAAMATAPSGADPTNSEDPSWSGCFHRVNDTAEKLLPCIRAADLEHHMRAFQAIADANPGPDGHPSRNSGEPGYKASADYVAEIMRHSGYDVTIQNYKFFYFAFTGLPKFSETSPTPHDYTVVTDWNPGQAQGSATAPLQAAGGIVIPPTPTPSSTSGCTAADFTGFTAGHIALIQRGGCSYGVKVQNAQTAGATGVIIFNEGNPGRTGVVNGSLVDANGNRIVPQIPVAFTSFATGSDLLTQVDAGGSAVPTMTIDVQAVVNPNADDYNVIADSKEGDPDHTVVVDAHLDAIYGAGMLDNASGSTTILNIAQLLHKAKPHNKLRFIWFGGEELGLLGSTYYVNNLSAADKAKIGYDLDADVTATPNYDVGVLDPAGVDLFTRTVSTQFPPNVYKPSQVARDLGIKYFDSIGKKNILFSPVGTDAFTFNQAGIPASGVLTGQDCCKLDSDVALFGGTTGNFEGNVPGTDGGCVDNPFRWCDNFNNNDFAVMEFMSRGFGNMVINMAMADPLPTAAPAAPDATPRTNSPATAGSRSAPTS